MSSTEERGSVFHTQGGAVFQNITASRDININHITQIRPLADEINASFFDSPEIFNNVQNELIGLISAIGMAHTRYTDFLDDEDFPALGQELKSCRRTLLDLQQLKQHYDDLPSNSKFNWGRMEMNFNRLTDIRSRISISRHNVTMLTNNMIACSQANVERLLRRLLKEQSDEGSVVSSLSSGSLSLSDDEAWEQIRKELQNVGMTPRAFDKNRTFILQFLEQAISEGDFLAASEPGSQSNESASELIEPQFMAISTPVPATAPQLRVNQPQVSIKAENNHAITVPVIPTHTRKANGLSRLVYRLTTSKEKFLQAAADGDLPLVMRSLDMNVDVDYHSMDGEPALVKAACNGHEKIVEVLVAHGAARKACSEMRTHCNTALCYAAAKGHTRIIELILDGGGTAEWCRDYNNTFWVRWDRPQSALAVAALSGQLYAVQVLLEKGASVDTLYGNGESEALIRASSAGHAHIVRYLLEKGARIDGSTSRGRTALSQAIYYQLDAMVTLLLSEGASVNMRDKELRTYLHLALAEEVDADVKGSKQEAMVRALLDHGASTIINAIDKNLKTPLLLAVTRGAAETVKLLVENGADVNKWVEDRMQPLLCAAKRDSSTIVHVLLEGGADAKAVNSLGESALWEAVSNNNITMARLLLEKGADPNSDHYGQTILIAAIREHSYSIVDLLLIHGADVNLRNKAGTTPLSLCMNAKKPETRAHIIHLLKSHGAIL